MSESEFFRLSHNVNNLVYHFVCPAKYRRIVFDEDVDEQLKQICLGIELRYEYIHFLEIGVDKDHVHFLIQSTPTHSPSEIIKKVKSIIARQIFAECPQVKKKLWGGNIWSAGYFVATVSEHDNEKQIQNYVRRQGKEYTKMYRSPIKLFD